MFEWKQKLLGRSYREEGDNSSSGVGDGFGSGVASGFGGGMLGGGFSGGLSGLGVGTGGGENDYSALAEMMGTTPEAIAAGISAMGSVKGAHPDYSALADLMGSTPETISSGVSQFGDEGVQAEPSWADSFFSFNTLKNAVLGFGMGGLPGLGVSLLGSGLNAAEPGLGSLAKAGYAASQGNPLGMGLGLLGAARAGMFNGLGGVSGPAGMNANAAGGKAIDPGQAPSLGLQRIATPAAPQLSALSRLPTTSSGMFGNTPRQDIMSLYELSQLLTPRG